ncbi:MAG: hypothetical protein WKG52_08460 [Variovorax sp.]
MIKLYNDELSGKCYNLRLIGEALAQAAKWVASGVRTSVGVNVSPRHSLRPDFIRRLAYHLDCHPDLHSGMLGLKILESTASRISLRWWSSSAIARPSCSGRDGRFRDRIFVVQFFAAVASCCSEAHSSLVRGMLDSSPAAFGYRPMIGAKVLSEFSCAALHSG